jgi:hypothetical protein
MDPVFPPYRIRDRFARLPRRPSPGVAIPWAVRAPSLRAARVLLDQLLKSGARSGEVIVAANGCVYVRWTE